MPLPPEGRWFTLDVDDGGAPLRVYEDLIEKKALTQPIVAGGAAFGTIIRSFGTAKSAFLPGTRIEVSFKDVNESDYLTVYTLTGFRKGGPF